MIFVPFSHPALFTGNIRMSNISGILSKKFIDLLACARHSCGPQAHEVPLFYPNCKWHFKSTPRYTYFDSRVVFFFSF